MVVTRLFQQVQKLEPQNLPALRIEKANLHRVQQYLAQRFWRINSLNFPPVRQRIAKRFVHDVYIGESFSNGMQRFGVCVDYQRYARNIIWCAGSPIVPSAAHPTSSLRAASNFGDAAKRRPYWSWLSSSFTKLQIVHAFSIIYFNPSVLRPVFGMFPGGARAITRSATWRAWT